MASSTQETDLLAAISNQMAGAVERIGEALVLVNGRRHRLRAGAGADGGPCA
jgi:hypothetical protein